MRAHLAVLSRPLPPTPPLQRSHYFSGSCEEGQQHRSDTTALVPYQTILGETERLFFGTGQLHPVSGSFYVWSWKLSFYQILDKRKGWASIILPLSFTRTHTNPLFSVCCSWKIIIKCFNTLTWRCFFNPSYSIYICLSQSHNVISLRLTIVYFSSWTQNLVINIYY